MSLLKVMGPFLLSSDPCIPETSRLLEVFFISFSFSRRIDCGYPYDPWSTPFIPARVSRRADTLIDPLALPREVP